MRAKQYREIVPGRATEKPRGHWRLCVAAAVSAAGCLSPSAVTRGARRISGGVAPAARAFAGGTGRLVQFAGQAAEDAALAARVHAAIAMRKGLEGSSISASCEEGRVRLTGRVGCEGQKRLAAGVARSTVGVKAVENRLRVSPRS